jgi:hypothetical protein
MGARNHKNYGQISVGPIGTGAHRMSYILSTGAALSADQIVMHKCDNPPCVNPEHLKIGTSKDNTQDAKTKGRLKNCGPKHRKGEDNSTAKLTNDEVMSIRRFLDAGVTQVEIARMFEITQPMVSTIKLRKTWSHI